MSDPFLIDQTALESKLKQLQGNFERWRHIRDSRDVAEFVARSDEFNWLSVELSQGIKNAGWDLDDLEETLKLITEGRQLSISDAEQRNRRQFIANARQLLSQISSEVLPSSGSRSAGGAAVPLPGSLATTRAVRGPNTDLELLTTTVVGGSGSFNVDHFSEEPASLDLLNPDDGGGKGGGGGRVIAAWKRRIGAAATFGPLRQMGLADVAGAEDGSRGGGGSGICSCLIRHRLRLIVAGVLAILLALLIAGILTAARTGGDKHLNSTSIVPTATGGTTSASREGN